ncbi:hypothetical protein OG21DRAFT_1410483 [Imleria badia]|nr:hypothetical protein OG21DRAFT_1410483 [Imleria badia]
MINSRVLEDLLEEPLGPYHDRDILRETLCQTKGRTDLVLYSFILEHDGHVTGLDESERPLEGPDDRKFRFRGILKIAKPEWLSEFGVKTIETDLNLRAKERAMRLGEGGRKAPQLTLENLFTTHLTRSINTTWEKEEDTQLTVLIQGERNMPAVYMRSTRVPNGLLWNSKAHNRNYEIATMDVETYSLSENFFWRWRLLALMEKIVKLYPHVPSKKRTPRWFVERYMVRLACPPEDRHRRLIFAEEDSDVDETGKTVTPRHLLKPHTSEILGLFAAQAEWFVTNNEMLRNKVFDFASWKKFSEEVRRQRKEAARERVRWGWPTGQEETTVSSEEDENEDAFSKLAKEGPVIGKPKKTVERTIRLAEARSEKRDTKERYSSGSGSERDAPGGAEYVSDFSEPSDAEENDSDQQLAEEEALDQIPWQLQVPPFLPDVDGRWWCPLEECNYQIDLYDLTEEEGRGIPEELVRYILQKQWRNAAYDEKVLQGFRCMVTNHYLKHFEAHGVKIERRDGRASSHSRFLKKLLTDPLQTRFVFINGRRRRQGGGEPIRGPMPVRGTLGGESRVVPIVHALQAGHFR